MARIHLNIRIFGRVQGVFFRHMSKQKAEALGITGFAQNMPDSSVYIEAEVPWTRLLPGAMKAQNRPKLNGSRLLQAS